MRYLYVCMHSTRTTKTELCRVYKRHATSGVMGGASGLLARLTDITPHPAMISISHACTGNIMQWKAFDVACQ